MRTICLLVTIHCVAHAATYYVDGLHGSDTKPGTSPQTAWKSLFKVSNATFHPGDRIRLKSGSVWHDQLLLRSSGTRNAPVVIDRYGDGALPRIDAGGAFEDAILLHNIAFIEIRNLEVTNHGNQPAVRRGVHIFLENFGTAEHIVVSDLYIHDVNGTNLKKDNGGIIFRTDGDAKPSRFDDLRIERNIVWKVDRSAIAAQSSHWPRTKWFPSLRVLIRDNLVDDIGGDGIVPWATDKVLVEHNIARNCNRRAKSYNAGIWPWSADNSVFQWNEASFTRTQMDGQGFDSDYNSRGTLFQYNYSHDNEGGFMLICSPGDRKPEENLGNLKTVVRRNISRNDRARIFHVSAVENALVEENAIYTGPEDVQMLLLSDWSGWANGVMFRRNNFYAAGGASYGHQSARHELGGYEIASGWGPARNIVFSGNGYYGHHINPPADPTGVFDKRIPERARDWSGPQFDPSNPGAYLEFIEDHRHWLERLMREEFGSIGP